MNKKDIYFEYATLPEEDGTFGDYCTYYMEHPQKDKEILIRACKEFSEYVHFCMSICVRFKHKRKNKYTQFADNPNDLDYDDYEINLFYEGISIYKDTDLSTVDYPNIDGLIKMNNLKEGYRGVFKHLLRGEFYLNEDELY
ncbi:hypothetical protein [Priestia megaterium]|uniref:hypothetical protein n=1 Tax=Priestia megaterium TaxID=1404 RepID=UPI002877A042|nr:hypothetical protein [Priestia megaterium]